MYNIPEMIKIAEIATQRIADIYKKYKFKGQPPRITPGMARVVIETFEDIKPTKINDNKGWG
jgi:hypothetical protein